MAFFLSIAPGSCEETGPLQAKNTICLSVCQGPRDKTRRIQHVLSVVRMAKRRLPSPCMSFRPMPGKQV